MNALETENERLMKRVEALSCLQALSELKNDHDQSLDEFFQRAVRLIISNRPNRAPICARIVYRDRQYATPEFEEGDVYDSAELVVDGESVGSVDLACRGGSRSGRGSTGPGEDRMLLGTLACEIAMFVQFKQGDLKLQQATAELRAGQQLLEDKNTALREVLDQIENEKRHITHQVQDNVDKVVVPIIRMLRNKVSPSEQQYLALLSSCLKEVTSPFISNLERRSQMLSPRESEICNMIRNGMASKEISAALGISLNTVLKQRQRIRKKLGITNNKTNLASYLRSI